MDAYPLFVRSRSRFVEISAEPSWLMGKWKRLAGRAKPSGPCLDSLLFALLDCPI